MSISSLGLYPPSAGVSVFPPAEQQARGVVAQASYQSSISDYGQIQNSLSTLQTSIQTSQSAALSADAPGRPQSGHAPQESQLFQNAPASAPGLSQITHAVQSFVNAYNASGSDFLASAPNSKDLAGIGVTANSSGKLSLDTGAFQNALTSNPAKVAQVFSSISETVKEVPVSAVASRIQTNPAPQQFVQPAEHTTQFASQSSSLPQNPAPAQRVQSQAEPSVPPAPPTLAAQYSIVSQLG